MKLLIDIPEDEYELVRHENKSYRTELVLMNAVAEGTPLPKHHGRLIDADEIIEEATKKIKYPRNHEYMECVIAHMKLAPTIIDAESEAQE